jgi:hypothetical protein
MNHPLQSLMPDAAREQAGELGRIATSLAGLHTSTPFADTNVFAGGGGGTGPTGSTGGVIAWPGYPTGPTGATGAPKRKPLCGAVYGPQDAIDLLNSHYLIGKSEQEVAIFRIRDDGLLTFTPPEQFKLDVANIFVQPSTRSAKSIPVEKFWKESPFRHQKVIVFEPTGVTKASEFNLWRGFAIEPREGWQQIRRLLRHILKVICRRDKEKFKYIVRWLAWAVQNPDRQAGVVIVLKSRMQGTGKSTLGVVMLKIFGQHGALIDDSDRLLGRFNDWVEPVSFILAEEILWANDHRTADKLKSRVTADTFQIERKNGAIRQIPNRLHLMMTTNHDHAVSSGTGDRRNAVYDVSDEHACDKAWFDALYDDLDQGGVGQFLRFLQNVKLDDWHPRQILRTAEATEQQRMSGDSVSQWSQACIEADAIIGDPRHGGQQHDLGKRIASEDLREAYTGFCKQHGVRAANQEVFGKACVEMFGPRQRLSTVALRAATQTVEDVGAPDEPDATLDLGTAALPEPRQPVEPGPATVRGKSRPWGYDVPDGDTWQGRIDGRLGIKK